MPYFWEAVIFGGAGALLSLGACLTVVRLRGPRPHALDRTASGASADQRLERIEQAIESIAIEVERVSEGQRFTTKLLAERAAVAQPLPPQP